MSTFNGRQLTEVEQRLHADKRCIACGAKVVVKELYESKKLATGSRSEKVGETWPMECIRCKRTRTHRYESDHNKVLNNMQWCDYD